MMFGKSKEPMAFNSELVEKFAKVLRKKASELTVAEDMFLQLYKEDMSPEFCEAIDIVLREVGIN